MSQKRIAVFVGSLRQDSLNRKMARALIAIAPGSLQLEIVDIGGLPLYDQDLEANPPAAWAELRQRLTAFDGLLFVTPEYNRSIPAALKNALDVGSRPPGKNVWAKKPAAVMSVSPSAIGGFGANHHLRQVLVCLGVPTLPLPEAYIGNAANLFDAAGQLTSESVNKLASKFITAFAAWVEAHGAVST